MIRVSVYRRDLVDIVLSSQVYLAGRTEPSLNRIEFPLRTDTASWLIPVRCFVLAIQGDSRRYTQIRRF